MNHPLLPVHRRPKIALFATGDELVPPGIEPGPGQIVYSNGFALAALARAEGAEVADLGVVGDKLDETIAAVRRARDLRRRYSGDDRRRFGRRLRSGAGGIRRRRHGIVVLEGGDAAGPSADARPARRDACARAARQSGIVLCVRVSLPGAADSPPRRPRRSCFADRIGGAGLRPSGERRARRLPARDFAPKARMAWSRPPFRPRTVP